MPKYQMIFDSDKIIPDDEFEELGKEFMSKHPEFHFKYGINLEGIKEEFWKRKEEVIDTVILAANDQMKAWPIHKVEQTFEDLSNLFNINE